MSKERRKYDRYLAPFNTFAALGQNFTTVGRVKEISLGGARVEYISDQDSLGSPSQVELFLTDTGFHLSGIPCRVVYDLPMFPPGLVDDQPFLTKKCGLAFGELLEDQSSKLRGFLETKPLGLCR